jgi:hypothetical protein
MLPDEIEIEETLCQRLARLDFETEIERADVGTRGEGWRMPHVLEVTVPKWKCSEFDLAACRIGGNQVSTGTAPQIRKTDNRSREMQEVREPQLWKVTKETPVLEGVYLGAQKITIKGKEAVQHMLEDAAGNRFLFLGTHDLQRKISPSHVGHWMKVEFVGEDRDVRTQGAALRRFRVSVSKEKEREFLNAHGVDVTDEDVPF